jgi:penicillin G amidase
LTHEDLQRFQTDPGSARADFFLPRILEAAARVTGGANSDSLVTRAATLLSEWDRRYTRDNTRAVLFEATMDEIAQRTWDELVDRSGGDAGRVATPGSAVLAELFADSTSAWWDVVATTERETLDDVIAASLHAALEKTRRDRGPEDGPGWRWDRIRFTNIYHLLRFPSLSALRLPVQGGPVTLSPSSGSGIEGASWRMVVELGDEVRAWVTYPGGQSGNPASPLYDDRIPQWLEGALSPVLLPRTAGDLPADEIRSVLIVRGEPKQ